MAIENNLLENELLIDSVSQFHLKETAMWAKFLAIAGFIISSRPSKSVQRLSVLGLI